MVTRYTIDQILSYTGDGGQGATSPAVAPDDEMPFGIPPTGRTSPASSSSSPFQTLDLSLPTGVRRRDEGISQQNHPKWANAQRPRETGPPHSRREEDNGEKYPHHPHPPAIPKAPSSEAKEKRKDEEEEEEEQEEEEEGQRGGHGQHVQAPVSTVARPVPLRLGHASQPTLHRAPSQNLLEPALAAAHLRLPQHLRAEWRPELLYGGGGRGERGYGLLEANGGLGGRRGERAYGNMEASLGGDVCGLMVQQYLEAHYRSLVAPRAFLPLGFPLLDPASLGYPNAAVSRSRRRGGQVRFTGDQTRQLETWFAKHKYITPQLRKTIARDLSLHERQVKTWFQNRRAKWRKAQTQIDGGAYHNLHLSPHSPSSPSSRVSEEDRQGREEEGEEKEEGMEENEEDEVMFEDEAGEEDDAVGGVEVTEGRYDQDVLKRGEDMIKKEEGVEGAASKKEEEKGAHRMPRRKSNV
ncbi:homeobox protein Hox-A4-like [Penaeus japonicus]|uniref:homeobox protein Hox-A4-like n=1 Tax=Penaeus japonicus TaxID=27405 RepID=UPI001C714C1E|nr:homeobox protein Hox-A4-like [Penaeus japonicus]